MDAALILIASDAELARACALVDLLWDWNDPTDVARLETLRVTIPRGKSGCAPRPSR